MATIGPGRNLRTLRNVQVRQGVEERSAAGGRAASNGLRGASLGDEPRVDQQHGGWSGTACQVAIIRKHRVGLSHIGEPRNAPQRRRINRLFSGRKPRTERLVVFLICREHE